MKGKDESGQRENNRFLLERRRREQLVEVGRDCPSVLLGDSFVGVC